MTFEEFAKGVRGLSCPLCCAPLDLEEGEYGGCSSIQYFNTVCTECSFAYTDVLSMHKGTTGEEIQKDFNELVEVLTKRCSG